MENSVKPIGIFDSGLGGLTALKALSELMPEENIIYLGDSARIPYGDKSYDEILSYVRSDGEFLINKGVKAILVACNTADSVGRADLAKRYSVPVVGVIRPAARAAAEKTKNGRIGIIATTATVKCGMYEKYIKEISPGAEIFSSPAPLIVPLVENGRLSSSDSELMSALHMYLDPLSEKGIDTLVLGCTHYPIVSDVIKELLPGVNIISSGSEAVCMLRSELMKNNLLNTSGKTNPYEFYVSGDVNKFSEAGEKFLGRPIKDSIKKIKL